MLLVVGSRWDLRWWYGNHCVGDSSSFGDYVVYFVFRLIDSEVPLSLARGWYRTVRSSICLHARSPMALFLAIKK